MSEAKFTKGPWVAGRKDMASIVDGVDSKWIYSGDEYVAIASGRVTGTWETVIANAHLIAAAPELYDLLESFPGFTNNCKIGDLWIEKRDEILAKARGEV